MGGMCMRWLWGESAGMGKVKTNTREMGMNG